MVNDNMVVKSIRLARRSDLDLKIQPLVPFRRYLGCAKTPYMQPIAQFICNVCVARCGITCTERTPEGAMSAFMEFCNKCPRRLNELATKIR